MIGYKKYKLTPSLGFEKIPAEWDLKKVKYLFHIGRGRVISQEELMDNGLYPVFSSQTQNNGCLGYINTFDFDCDQLTWTTDGANAGTVFIRSGKHNCTNVCGTLQPIKDQTNLKFSHYALQYATQFHKRPDTNGAKIMNNEMAEISFALPAECEQFKIIEYLDHETAKIDSLIAKQEKLIELLKEKRQAVISHAVTKGLNPDVPMKDSGVEWLGQVPEHWEISPIKFVLENKDYKRIPLSAEERGNRSGDYRYYGASGVIDYIDDYIFDEPNVLVGEDGANLVNRNTPLAFPAYGKYWVNNHAHILHPQDSLADYWAELIEIIDISPLVSGSAQPKLTAEALKNLKISFPLDLEERKAIDIFIKHQKVKFDFLISKATNQIELLKERRTALISSAVTGKIDVRNWQNPKNNNEAKSELSA